MKNEFPDSRVEANGTETHNGCGGDILYFKEGWICSKCGESGPDEDEEPLELTEKMALGIVGLAIITELVSPGRASKVASMIEAIGRVLPCDIGKPVDPGRESTEDR